MRHSAKACLGFGSICLCCSFGLEVMNDLADLLDHDTDIVVDRIVGDAQRGVTLQEEDVVAAAVGVVLVGDQVIRAVDFDDQSACLPQQVDLAAATKDLHGMIPPKERFEFVIRGKVLGQMLLDGTERMRLAVNGFDHDTRLALDGSDSCLDKSMNGNV